MIQQSKHQSNHQSKQLARKTATTLNVILQGLSVVAMGASLMMTTACAKGEGHVPVLASGRKPVPKAMKSFTGYSSDPSLASSIVGASAESSKTSAEGAAPTFSVIVKILYKTPSSTNAALMGYASNISPNVKTTLIIPSAMGCADVETVSRFQITVSCDDADCNRLSTLLIAKDSAVLPNLTGAEIASTDASLTGYHESGLLFLRRDAIAEKRREAAAAAAARKATGSTTISASGTEVVKVNTTTQTVVGKSQMDLVWSAPWTESGKSGMLTSFDEAVGNSSTSANTPAAGSTCVMTLTQALAAGMPAGKPVPTADESANKAAGTANTQNTGDASGATNGVDQKPAPLTDANGVPKNGAAEGIIIDGQTPVTAADQSAAATADATAGAQGSATSSANGIEIQQTQTK